MTTPEATEDSDGISWSDFKSIAFDTGNWIWGTAQGAFNEKATTSQIVTDAVISLIPLLGDATGIRDLIAVTMGMVEDPKKREEKLQWLMLVLFVVALIPVIGGPLKGIGRLAVKAAEEAAKLANASARTAKLMEAAKDVIAVLNRLGKGHAEKWMLQLKFADSEARVIEELNKFFATISAALQAVENRLGRLLPDNVHARIQKIRKGLQELEALVSRHVPTAIKDLDAKLREIQQYIREGGEITSKTVNHAAAVGEKNMSHLEEARLIEGSGQAEASLKRGFEPNSATPSDAIYTVEPGYPDLTHSADGPPIITTFSGKVTNGRIPQGGQIYRVFGPGGTTRGVKVRPSSAAGSTRNPVAFWGYGPPPSTGEAWRHEAAVLDEWNGNGFIVVGTVVKPDSVKATVGTIARQESAKIKGQVLLGGGTQAVIEFPVEVRNALNELGALVATEAGGTTRTVELGGVLWEIRPTQWSNVNGAIGYSETASKSFIETTAVRLAKDEAVSSTQE